MENNRSATPNKIKFMKLTGRLLARSEQSLQDQEMLRRALENEKRRCIAGKGIL